MKVVKTVKKPNKKQGFRQKDSNFGFYKPEEDCEGGMSTVVTYPGNVGGGSVGNSDSYAPGDNRIPGSLFGGRPLKRKKKEEDSEDKLTDSDIDDWFARLSSTSGENEGERHFTTYARLGSIEVRNEENKSAYPLENKCLFIGPHEIGRADIMKAQDDPVGCRVNIAVYNNVINDMDLAGVSHPDIGKALEALPSLAKRVLLSCAVWNVFNLASVQFHNIHIPVSCSAALTDVLKGVDPTAMQAKRENGEILLRIDPEYWNNYTRLRNLPFAGVKAGYDVLHSEDFVMRFLTKIDEYRVFRLFS